MKSAAYQATIDAILVHEDPAIRRKPKLTADQLVLKDRFYKSALILHRTNTMFIASKMVMAEFGVCRNTAYDYLNAAITIYGNPIEYTKKFMLHRVTEAQYKLYEKVMAEHDKIAARGGDTQKLLATASNIIDRIATYHGVGKEDDALLDISKMQRAQVTVVVVGSEQMAQFADVMDIPHDVIEKQALNIAAHAE